MEKQEPVVGLCVCGHDHLRRQLGRPQDEDYHCAICDLCACGTYRPVLNFPNKEASWWVWLCGTYCRYPVLSRIIDGDMQLANPMTLDLEAYMTREEWGQWGGVKVVKAEPCPFARYASGVKKEELLNV